VERISIFRLVVSRKPLILTSFGFLRLPVRVSFPLRPIAMMRQLLDIMHQATTVR
jgi:hypothetical protein